MGMGNALAPKIISSADGIEGSVCDLWKAL